jgi:hypothetical protein
MASMYDDDYEYDDDEDEGDEYIPFGPPEDCGREKEVEEEGPLTVCLADVAPAETAWLWPGRIPLGYLTCVLGPRGAGKSFLALDLAARVTRGAAWPDDPSGTPAPAGSVLLVVAEDRRAETVAARLRAAGADMSKVHELTATRNANGGGRRFTLSDLGRLERAVQAHPDLRLLVIDPVAAFLGYTNDRRTRALPKALEGLAELAARHGVAVVLVNATDKGATGLTWSHACDALPALRNASRAVWAVAEDPDEPWCRLFVPSRINLAADPGGLWFAIDRKAGRVAWGAEPVALRAEALRPAPRAGTDVAKAARWLRPFLEPGPRPAEEVLREGTLAGHSRRALYAAKQRLGISSSKAPGVFAGRWFWTLPGRPPSNDEGHLTEGRGPRTFEHSAPRATGGARPEESEPVKVPEWKTPTVRDGEGAECSKSPADGSPSPGPRAAAEGPEGAEHPKIPLSGTPPIAESAAPAPGDKPAGDDGGEIPYGGWGWGLWG